MSGSHILRSDDLRAENRHRVLRALREAAPISRARLGKLTGLSQAALSTLLGELGEQGLVASTSPTAAARKPGRPQSRVSLSPAAGFCVTVAFRVDNFIVCTIDYAGKTTSYTEIPLMLTTFDSSEVTKSMTHAIKDAVSKFPGDRLLGISVGFQGVTDSKTGDLLWSPILSVDRVPIAATLRKKFSVDVSVHNDCVLIASALHSAENEKLGNSFAAILFSHGIGMGAYLSGKPLYGAQSSALELGHIQFVSDGALCRCGKRGCIEAYAADYGISRTATGNQNSPIPAGKISDDEFDRLIVAAQKGERHAVEAFRLAGKAIGSGLATVFNLFDPMPVALVGHNSDAVRLMSSEIEEALGAVSREPVDYSGLIHCYRDDLALLLDGLILNAMALADREFADYSEHRVGEQAYS